MRNTLISDLEASIRPIRVVAFLVQRVGPYHHARLRALAAEGSLSLSVVEFRPSDSVYAWEPVVETGSYRRIQASSNGELVHALESVQPDVVVCVGYSDSEIHRAASWALARGVPLVACSDSTFDDEPRSGLKEAFKRLVLSGFDAALVAGTRSHHYLGTLGMDADTRFRPWDVVDNAHFERGADSARLLPAEFRRRLKLPDRYFICTARFIPKKNLTILVDAYARYVATARESAWSLVLSGSGPLEGILRAQVAAEGLGTRVCFPGFVQYPDLPAFYGLAGAAILPSSSDQWGLVVNEAMAAGLPVLVSSRCGCAPDLVCSAENGHTFEPDSADVLAGLMRRVAGMDKDRLASMGNRSRDLIAAYTPGSFAKGLNAAIECALVRKPRRSRILTRVVISTLAMRNPR